MRACASTPRAHTSSHGAHLGPLITGAQELKEHLPAPARPQLLPFLEFRLKSQTSGVLTPKLNTRPFCFSRTLGKARAPPPWHPFGQ